MAPEPKFCQYHPHEIVIQQDGHLRLARFKARCKGILTSVSTTAKLTMVSLIHASERTNGASACCMVYNWDRLLAYGFCVNVVRPRIVLMD